MTRQVELQSISLKKNSEQHMAQTGKYLVIANLLGAVNDNWLCRTELLTLCEDLFHCPVFTFLFLESPDFLHGT